MKTLTTILLVCLSLLAVAQDEPETLLHNNPMRLNPAFAGAAGRGRIHANYRIQWPKQDGGYSSLQVNYDNYVAKIKSGVGLTYYFAHFPDGVLLQHGMMLHYAFHGETKGGVVFRPTLSIGFFREKVQNLVFAQPDPTFQSKYTSFNLGAGIVSYYKGFVVGYYGNHLNRADNSFEYNQHSKGKLITHKTHASYKYKLGDNSSIAASFYYFNQSSLHVLQPVVSGSIVGVNLGIGYRVAALNGFSAEHNGKWLLIMVGYSHDRFNVAYAYDHLLSEVRETYGTTHEVSLAYIFAKKQSTESITTYDDFVF